MHSFARMLATCISAISKEIKSAKKKKKRKKHPLPALTREKRNKLKEN